MLRRALPIVLTALVIVPAFAQSRAAAPARPGAQPTAQVYFPERLDWQKKKPEEVGMDSALIAEAVKIAIAAEAQDAERRVASFRRNSFGKEPFNTIIGPLGSRRRRRPDHPQWLHRRRMGRSGAGDMTDSVTKTFLTTIVGLAFQKGLIKDVNDYARDYMPPDIDLFAPSTTARSMGSPAAADQRLAGHAVGQAGLGRPPGRREAGEWANRQLWEPGTHFKYNDVRVNVLALAALQVWREPLPDVLREEVMEPIGASSTWRWYGYDNSWVEIDGKKVQSVSGGGHWGGGMFINVYDMARFGYLFLRNGKWKDREIVSPRMDPDGAHARERQCHLRLRELVSEHRPQAAPGRAGDGGALHGNGANIIYIDWENDIVAVFRWIAGDGTNSSVAKIIASLKAPAKTTTSSEAANSQRVVRVKEP